MHEKFGVSVEVKRASQPLINLKNNSNLIGPCGRLLQEDITLLHKISRTFHKTYQSNMIIVRNLSSILLGQVVQLRI